MRTQKLTGKPLAWVLTLIYFASYVTRINLAAVIQEIITDTGFGKSELSVVLVGLSITYGLGQIVNGILGDHIKPQNLIFMGLLLASGINLALPFIAHSVAVMAVLWAINGFAQAMMWPPIVKILVACCDDEMYGYSVVRISWGSSFGTIAVYLLAPLIIGFAGWQGVFITCAVVGLAVTALWFFLKRGINIGTQLTSQRVSDSKEKFRFPKPAVFPMIFIALGIIFQGMLRDGVTSWMPTYLAEVFDFGNKTSIFCTLSLAVFSIVMFQVAGKIYSRFFKNEVTCGGFIFAFAAAAALLMFFLFEGGAIISIAAMTLITGCMHGVNLMLITHVPKRFRKYGSIATISGIINSCTYIGAAISTYGVALLSELAGWRSTVGIWFIIALVGTTCCFIAAKPWQKFAIDNKE